MADADKKVIELFYDTISPYSWIAFEVLCRYKSRWNIDLRLRPFSLAAVVTETGNRPPGRVPAKLKWMGRDLMRQAHFYKIPFRGRKDPNNDMANKDNIKPMFLLTAVSMDCPQHLERLTRELWLRFWSREEDITQPASLEAAATVAGIPADQTAALLAKLEDETVKARLTETTQEALRHGAFGAPTIVAHVGGKPHMYWGSDRFLLIADLLGEEWLGPLTELAHL